MSVLEGLPASFIAGNRKRVTSEATFGVELALCGNVNVSPGASSTPAPACGLGELSSFPLKSCLYSIVFYLYKLPNKYLSRLDLKISC